MLDRAQEQILKRLKDADGRDFTTLVKIAKLDPTKDLREADLRGVDFGTADLSGFDFTGANLSGARLDQATTGDAIFDKALTEGVIWPSHANNQLWRERPIQHELHPFQSEALQRILDALLVKSPQGGIVSMPAGTGRATIVERLLIELDEGGRYYDVLLVVETAAEREQYLARLGKLTPSRFVSGFRDGRKTPGNLTIEVATSGALRAALKNHDDATMHRLMKMGLVIVIASPGALLNTALLLRKLNTYNPLIGFTSLHGGMTSQISQLHELFGNFLYVLEVEQALRNRLLTQAIVERRRLAPSEGVRLTTGELSWPNEDLFNDLTYQIVERSRSTQCLVICRDVGTVEYVASRLATGLEGLSSKRALAISSRSAQPEFWQAVDKQDVVLVMTPAMALASTERAIWNSGLTAVLTAIGSSLADRLRFRPLRANRSPDVVLDYTDSFERWDSALESYERSQNFAPET